MQLKTIIYTTSRSFWIKELFENIYKVIGRAKAVTVHDFEVEYFTLPKNVPTVTRSNGGVYIDWDWFEKTLHRKENNAVCLHITRRERAKIGMKHPTPGKSLGGVFNKDNIDQLFQFVVIADGPKAFERLFLHELSHGFAFWKRAIDYTHTWDYVIKQIAGIFYTYDFSRWDVLMFKIKQLRERIDYLIAKSEKLHAPLDVSFMNRVTQPFGVRDPIKYPRTGHHVGTDFGAPVGENCYAVADGYVTKVIENDPVLGNATYFKYKWEGKYYTARYLHQSRLGKLGSKKRGDYVGVTGNTGLSTGPHLHFDISRGDFNLNGLNGQNFETKFIDPMSLEYEGVKK